MKTRLLIARTMFVIAAVVLAGGSVLIYRTGTAYEQLKAREDDLASKREKVRANLVQNKLDARVYSKSISEMPDSIRFQQSGTISRQLSDYQKAARVFANEEHAVSLDLADIRKERSVAGARLRREIISAGSGTLLALLAGGWLLLSARSAFRT